MSNTNTAMKAAPPRTKPPARRAEREELALAIQRRTEAEKAVEAGKRAVTRAGDAIEAAERKAEKARAEVATAGDRDADALAQAIADGEVVTTHATRAAITTAQDAEHEVAATTSAHRKLRARQKDLDAALLSAQRHVTENVHRVIRVDAGALLAEAQQAASRLRELLPILNFMREPNRDSPSTPMVWSSGGEHGEAISKFVENPRSKPDDWHEWYGAPVAQWRVAREKLHHDADAPLPPLPR